MKTTHLFPTARTNTSSSPGSCHFLLSPDHCHGLPLGSCHFPFSLYHTPLSSSSCCLPLPPSHISCLPCRILFSLSLPFTLRLPFLRLLQFSPRSSSHPTPALIPLQFSPRSSSHPAPALTPLQFSTYSSSQPTPALILLELSTRSSSQPAPALTPLQFSPRSNAHPASVFISLQLSPRSSSHPLPILSSPASTVSFVRLLCVVSGRSRYRRSCSPTVGIIWFVFFHTTLGSMFFHFVTHTRCIAPSPCTCCWTCCRATSYSRVPGECACVRRSASC